MNDQKPKILIAEVTALPSTVDQVRELLTDYGRTVRQEPGNRVFTCYQVVDRPEKFIVYEVYADEGAFRAHLTAPENASVNERLGPLVEGPGSVLTFLEAVE